MPEQGPAVVLPIETPASEVLISMKVKALVMVLSLVFAGVNLGLAWGNAYDASGSLTFDSKQVSDDMACFVNKVAGTTNTATTAEVRLEAASHLFKVVAQHHSGASVHTTATLAVAGGFSLLAIGFALFLIGADGAFRLQLRHGNNSRMMLSGTAPGLLCFVAGCGLIVVGVLQRPHIETPALNFSGTSPAPNNTPESKPLWSGRDI